jgi:hypothetical protein
VPVRPRPRRRTFMGTVRRHSRRLISVSLVKMSVMGLGVYFAEYAIVRSDWRSDMSGIRQARIVWDKGDGIDSEDDEIDVHEYISRRYQTQIQKENKLCWVHPYPVTASCQGILF